MLSEEIVSTSKELSPTFTFETLTNGSLESTFFNCGFPYEENLLLNPNVSLLSVNAGFFLERVVCVSNVLMTFSFFRIIDGFLIIIDGNLEGLIFGNEQNWGVDRGRAGGKRRRGLAALKNYKWFYMQGKAGGHLWFKKLTEYDQLNQNNVVNFHC